MGYSTIDHSALFHNQNLFKDASQTSTFSVFREGKQIFDTLKVEDLEKLRLAGADVNDEIANSK